MTTVLDPAQLVRIQATHRGFLYQHLYTVALLLSAERHGTRHVRVERDQDIELVGPTGVSYIQVKTRIGRALMPSDLGNTLDEFSRIRSAHDSGLRTSAAAFVIVSNQPAGDALSAQAKTWPADVTFLSGQQPPAAAFPDAPRTVDGLFAHCSKLAESAVLSRLSPDTLVWKLAALVAAAAANVGDEGFDVEEMPRLFEFVNAELHLLPRVEGYLPQQDEPVLEMKTRVRFLIGHSGAGKSAWASQAVAHNGGLTVYFRCFDVADEQLAPRLVREAVARIADRFGHRASSLVLPGATGLEALTALDRAMDSHGRDLMVIVDDAHRLSSDAMVNAVESTRSIRWVFLTRPDSKASSAAARLQAAEAEFKGWETDTIARVLLQNDCVSDPRAIQDVGRLTGGSPLLVRRVAQAIGRSPAASTRNYVERLRAGGNATPSPHEVILASVVEDLPHRDLMIAAALALVDAPLHSDVLTKVLGVSLGLSTQACARSLRSLSAGGCLVAHEGGELALHDSFRPVLDLELNTMDQQREVLRGIAEHLTDGLVESRSSERLVACFRALQRLGDLQPLAELATELSEWIRELGEAPVLRSLLTEALRDSANLGTADRFWAEDTLAFFEIEEGDLTTAESRLPRLHDLAELLGTRERGAVLNKRVLLEGRRGDLNSLQDIMEEASALPTDLGRIVRYNAACAYLQCGYHAEAASELSRLSDEYLAECGLDRSDVFRANPDALSVKLADAEVDIDIVRHLADCFDALSFALEELPGQEGPAALMTLWAFKFFVLSAAPTSIARVGQRVADGIVTVDGPEAARAFLEETLLPVLRLFGLIDHEIQARSQHAVVCAMTGDFDAARQQMDSIQPFVAGLSEERRLEVENQWRLIHSLEEPRT